MLKSKFLIFIFILFSTFTYSQNKYNIKIKINGFENKILTISKFTDITPEIIDTILSDNLGTIFFNITDKSPQMYRLSGFDKKHFDFIYNNENVEIETDLNNFIDNTIVTSSEENKIYFEILKQEKMFKHKLDILNQLLYYYPQDNDFFKEIKIEYLKVQNQRNDYLNQIIDKNKHRYVSKLTKTLKTPILDPTLTPRERLQISKNEFWKNIDFNDNAIHNSNAISNKTLDYFAFYNEIGYSREQLEDSLFIAVNNILEQAKTNQQAVSSIAKYFIILFNDYGFDHILKYLYDYYLFDEACQDIKQQIDIKLRYEAFNKMQSGTKIDDFEFTDINGKKFRFSKNSSKLNILLFWSSECPHCSELTKDLKSIYKATQDSLEVIAISLDTDEKKLQQYIKTNGISWVNYCDFKSWNTDLAKQFYVYTLPTLYIIDRYGTIIRKTNQINEIKNIIGYPPRKINRSN